MARIMIVDDEPELLEVLTEVLTAAGDDVRPVCTSPTILAWTAAASC